MPIFATNAGSFSPLSIKSIHGAGSGAVADYLIENSLLFDSSSSSYLSRTPAGAGNRKTWTANFWMKYTASGATQQSIIQARTSSNTDDTGIGFENDKIKVVTGAVDGFVSTAVFQDPAGWYNFHVIFNTTNQPNDRIQVWCNGVRLSAGTYNAPTLNSSWSINNNVAHNIGRHAGVSSQYFNGLLSNFYLIDGQELEAADFGEFDATTGIWKPKAFDSTPNNGTVWSSGWSGTNMSGYEKAESFDGIVGTDGNNATRTDANTTLTWTNPNTSTPFTKLELWAIDDGATINVNGTDVSSQIGLSYSDTEWYEITGVGNSLSSIDLVGGAGTAPFLWGVKIDGSILIDGFNQFTNGTFYSNYGVSVNADPTLRLWTHAFDGSDGSYVTGDGNTNNQSLWTYPNGIAVNTSLRLKLAGGTNSFVYVNGSQVAGVTSTAVGSPTWYTVTGVSNLTSIGVGNNGSTWSTLHQIEVDGTVLTDATVGRNSFHLNFSNGVNDQSGTSNNWTANGLLPTNYTGTVQFGAASPSDNTFDSPSTSITKDTTGYSYSTVSNPKRDTGDANNATVLKTLDGTQIYWKFEDDNQNTNRYIHVSNDGINWTSPGSVYQTSTGPKVVGPSSWVVWAGGSNSDVTTVSWQGDVFVDSPTNATDVSVDTGLGGELASGYSVLNLLAKAPSATLSEGSLTMTSGAAWESTLSTIPFIGGKWYYEVTTVNNQYSYVGVSRMSHNYLVDYPSKNKSWAMVNDGTCYYDQVGGNASSTATGVSVGDNGTVGVAIDADNGKIWWAINGTWLNNGSGVGNPATGAYPMFRNIPTDELLVACMDVYDNTGTANFGATPFKYQAPSGFKCLCEANLADPAVPNPSSTAMTVVTYTGDGNSSKTIDCGFAPDIVWIKESTPTPTGGDFSHRISNSVFGAGNSMSTNLTNTLRDHSAEAGGGVETFTSTGFTVEQGTTNNNNQNNLNSDYVAWVWGGCSTPTHTATTYNQDQVWRNVGTITGTPWNDDNSSFKGVFNGVLGNTGGGNSAFANANTAYKYTFPSGGVPVTTNIEIYYWKNGGTLTVNAGEPDAYTITASTGAYTSDVITTISTLKNIQLETGTNTGPYVSGIKVDGKLLVDADVLPIGVMNDQVYDQSVIWSDYVTGTAYSASYPFTNGFDGNLSTRTLSNSATLLSFDPPSAITVNDKLEVWLGYQDHTATQVLKVNSTDYSQLIDTSGYNQGWITIPDVTSLTKLEFGSTPGGSEDSSLSAIRIDGKILVDSGATPANVPNVPSYVRTNKDAGISIVGWEGVADAAPYHGMGKDPQLVITKSMTSAVAWRIWYSAFTDRTADYLGFDAGAIGTFGGTYWNIFNMNINTIGLPSSTYDNNVGDMVAYCFAEVPGFSRIGRYNATQPFVTTGFTPRWLLLRDVTAENWCLYDSERGNTTRLEPNTTNGNVSNANIQVDFHSNGFKITGGGTTINGDVLYAAFAESPQKLNLAV